MITLPDTLDLSNLPRVFVDGELWYAREKKESEERTRVRTEGVFLLFFNFTSRLGRGGFAESQSLVKSESMENSSWSFVR